MQWLCANENKILSLGRGRPGAYSLAIGLGFAKDIPSSQAMQLGEAVLQLGLVFAGETCLNVHSGPDSRSSKAAGGMERTCTRNSPRCAQVPGPAN